MFAVIVLLMIGILVAFTVVWVVVPSFRAWIETPKYTMLDRERRFEADRNEQD